METGREHLDLWDVVVETAFEDGKAIVKVDAGVDRCVRGRISPVSEGACVYTDGQGAAGAEEISQQYDQLLLQIFRL